MFNNLKLILSCVFLTVVVGCVPWMDYPVSQVFYDTAYSFTVEEVWKDHGMLLLLGNDTVYSIPDELENINEDKYLHSIVGIGSSFEKSANDSVVYITGDNGNSQKIIYSLNFDTRDGGRWFLF